SYSQKVPTIGIFGPSNSELLCPDDTVCFSIQSTATCSPCYGNELFGKCDMPFCMDYITVDVVYKKSIEILFIT
ncbi:MAG: hypothetical protein L3V56_14670, partial [Candidatus Magnetoovum sp. WYHC-5]|nr:hypothetical protein [Candidatus Magnetoovum sp. WYHC-5]